MQLLHDTTLLYSLIATIAAGGIVVSRGQEGRAFVLLNDRRTYSWIVPALSILASSIFQFWIIALPLLPLNHPEILILFALFASLLLPIFLLRNPAISPQRFRDLLSSRLRKPISVIVLVFYAFVQPLALLYLAEHTLSHYFMNSSYFSLVFLVVVAGICALLGGKNVAAYMSMPFAVTVAVVAIGMAYFGIEISDLLAFLRFPMEEATQFFVARNFAESSWIYGCAGFCVVSWWIWWTDKGVVLASDIFGGKADPSATIFSSACLVGLSLMFLSGRTSGIFPQSIPRAEYSLFLRRFDVLAFFLLLGLVLIFISAFVRSFQIIGSILQTQLYDAEPNGERSEKHILVARLAIMSGVLLSIFLIPFAQQWGVELLFVYVAYLACFVTSFAAIFVVFLIWQSRSEAGIVAGVLGGLSGGIIAMVLLIVQQRPSAGLRLTPYEIATGIFLLSFICAVGAIYFYSERIHLRASSKTL